MNKIKKCNTCKIEKSLGEFRFRCDKNYYLNKCKNCENDYMKNITLAKIIKICPICPVEKSYDEFKFCKIKACKKCRNEIKLKNKKLYVCKNKEKQKANKINQRNKIKKDPVKKLRRNISANILKFIKRKNGRKCKSILCKLNYSIEDLKQHLEKLFEPWMNWDNHGVYDPKTHDDSPTWQLDHIIPHSTFNYDSMDHPDFLKCWNLSNLRPLDAKQNHYDGVNRIRHK